MALALISERKTPPCRAGQSSASLLWWETVPVPQGLRASTPVERWRQPSYQRTGKTVTAEDLRPVRRVRPTNPQPVGRGAVKSALSSRCSPSRMVHHIINLVIRHVVAPQAALCPARHGLP